MKRLLEKFFNYMEYISIKKNQWKLIPDSELGYIFVDIMEYKGKQLELSDGTIIKKGDMVGEIHVNNKKMRELNPRTVLRAFISELKLLTKAMNENERFSSVKAIFGRTVLYPIPKRVGFDVYEINNKVLKVFLRIWDNLIKLVFSSSNKGRFIMKEPKEVWISKKRLYNKMGDN